VVYIPLHVHTVYSPYESLITIEELVSRASFLEFPAIGITDHWSTYGHFEFYRLAKEHGIKPVFGCEVCHRSLTGDEEFFHLTILAENDEGYKNLTRLVSLHFTKSNGRYVTVDELNENSLGLIVLTGCMKAQIVRAIDSGRGADARKALERIVEIFGAGNVYVELMNHGMKKQFSINEKLVQLAGEMGIKTIVTNNDRFIDKKDVSAFIEMLRLADKPHLSEYEGYFEELYLKKHSELRKYYFAYEDALDRCLEVADRCTVELGDKFHVFFDSFAEADYAIADLARRRYILSYHGIDGDHKYKRRLEKELDHLKKRRLTPFIFFLFRLFQRARGEGIHVEVSSGELLRSFICYLLELVPLDPVTYGFKFDTAIDKELDSSTTVELILPVDMKERFIEIAEGLTGEGRLFFDMTREEMSMQAIVSKLCDIYRIKESIRKVILAELSFHSSALKLGEFLDSSDQASRLYLSDGDLRYVLRTAFSLKGKIIHLVMNSSKVVILPEGISASMSRVKGKGNVDFLMLDQRSISSLRFWVFGLQQSRFLTAIEETSRMLLSRRGRDGKREKRSFLKPVNLNDAKTFKMISEGDTEGVYFLEGRGIKELLVRAKPRNFGELVNCIALYKPSTIGAGLWKRYVGEVEVRGDWHDKNNAVDKVLKRTKGILLFDNQIEEMLVNVAGLPENEASEIAAELKTKGAGTPSIRLKFINCAMDKGVSEEEAEKVFDFIEKHMGFVQNEADTSIQAYMSYRTAYLKANHFLEYFVALLNSYTGISERQTNYISYLESRGVKLLGIDINKSGYEFVIEEEAIRYPISFLHGVDRNSLLLILEERKKGGDFSSLEDFMDRVGVEVKAGVIETLIDSGAFDWTGSDRGRMKDYCRRYLRRLEEKERVDKGEVLKEHKKKPRTEQLSLFEEE